LALEPNGTRIHDQKIATALGPRWIGWREGLIRTDAGHPAECSSSAAMSPTARRPNARLPRPADHADARQPRQVAIPGDGIP